MLGLRTRTGLARGNIVQSSVEISGNPLNKVNWGEVGMERCTVGVLGIDPLMPSIVALETKLPLSMVPHFQIYKQVRGY